MQFPERCCIGGSFNCFMNESARGRVKCERYKIAAGFSCDEDTCAHSAEPDQKFYIFGRWIHVHVHSPGVYPAAPLTSWLIGCTHPETLKNLLIWCQYSTLSYCHIYQTFAGLSNKVTGEHIALHQHTPIYSSNSREVWNSCSDCVVQSLFVSGDFQGMNWIWEPRQRRYVQVHQMDGDWPWWMFWLQRQSSKNHRV